MTNLFSKTNFISHSGIYLNYKIECDALTSEDIDCLAYMISSRVVFSDVVGIPNGGLRLASGLKRYCSVGPRLVVDDVLTTGKSMLEYLQPKDVGFVIFARNKIPDKRIRALFIDGEAV